MKHIEKGEREKRKAYDTEERTWGRRGIGEKWRGIEEIKRGEYGKEVGRGERREEIEQGRREPCMGRGTDWVEWAASQNTLYPPPPHPTSAVHVAQLPKSNRQIFRFTWEQDEKKKSWFYRNIRINDKPPWYQVMQMGWHWQEHSRCNHQRLLCLFAHGHAALIKLKRFCGEIGAFNGVRGIYFTPIPIIVGGFIVSLLSSYLHLLQ